MKLFSLFALLCAVAVSAFALPKCTATPPKFAHPGVSHNLESIQFVKGKIRSGEEPWASAWKGVRASRYASLDWQPQACAHVERGPSNDPNIGSSDFSADASAAYRHALLWTLTDNEPHAKKAAEILNAWSATLQSISNHDARLLVGMEGYEYCNAAELLKHTWDGWPPSEQSQFATMLRKIFYPIIEDFYPSANGNWDASMLQTMLAMGVFLDDREMFNRGVEYYLVGKGNGAVGNYFKPSGQCQESGRDQGHTQMGLDYLACTCEIGWNQGLDLYAAYDNRLLKGFEYTAKYNLGLDVPYEPYRSFEGRYHYKSISDESRGRLRPMYEKVLNHYENRKALDATFTRQAVAKLRETSSNRVSDKPNSRRRRSRRNRSSAIGTLMFSSTQKNATRKNGDARPRVVCFGDSITNRGYNKTLSEILNVEAINAGVGGNTTTKGLRRMSADVLEKTPDAVVILFGTNDLRADAAKVFVPLEKYQFNLEAMVDACQQAGAQVVLCTVPPIEHSAFFERHEPGPFDSHGGLAEMITAYSEAVRKVAASREIPLVDLNELLSKEPKWLSKDGVHPSESGSTLIAKHIAVALITNQP